MPLHHTGNFFMGTSAGEPDAEVFMKTDAFSMKAGVPDSDHADSYMDIIYPEAVGSGALYRKARYNNSDKYISKEKTEVVQRDDDAAPLIKSNAYVTAVIDTYFGAYGYINTVTVYMGTGDAIIHTYSSSTEVNHTAAETVVVEHDEEAEVSYDYQLRNDYISSEAAGVGQRIDLYPPADLTYRCGGTDLRHLYYLTVFPEDFRDTYISTVTENILSYSGIYIIEDSLRATVCKSFGTGLNSLTLYGPAHALPPELVDLIARLLGVLSQGDDASACGPVAVTVPLSLILISLRLGAVTSAVVHAMRRRMDPMMKQFIFVLAFALLETVTSGWTLQIPGRWALTLLAPEATAVFTAAVAIAWAGLTWRMGERADGAAKASPEEGNATAGTTLVDAGSEGA